MEIGFNNDVVYRGITFHIQTEDHGGGDQKVSTQLFYRGAILDTRTISYSNLVKDISDDEERRAKVRKVMVKSHRSLYKRLFNGEYDSALGEDLDDAPPGLEEDMTPPDEFVPSQQRVPEVARVLEEDGKVTFTFDHGDQIDLDALSRQLSQIDIYGDRDRPAASGPSDGSEFDNLFSEFMPPTNGASTGRRAAVAPPAPPVDEKVRFRPTGRRAFQGLIEPSPDTRVLDLVREFLARNPSRS